MYSPHRQAAFNSELEAQAQMAFFASFGGIWAIAGTQSTITALRAEQK